MRLIQPAEVIFSSRTKSFGRIGKIFESSRSSVSLSLQAFIESLETQTVVWYTDNQNVAHIVNIGSKVPALQKIALDMHQCCLIRVVINVLL